MAHNYLYGLRLDSEGSGTAVSAWTTMWRITPEQSPVVRITPTVIPNRHGDLTPARGFYGNYDFVVEALLDYTVPESTSKVYEHRSELLQRMTSHVEQCWLTRDTDFQGLVEIPFRVLRPPQTTDPENLMSFICRTMEPFWRDQAVSFSAVNPVSGITNTGDAPIADGIIVLSGHSGTQRLTNTTTGEWVEVNDDTTSNAITIDCAARTIKQSGADVDGISNFDARDEWFMEVVPGANSFTLSGSGSATFTGREKHL